MKKLLFLSGALTMVVLAQIQTPPVNGESSVEPRKPGNAFPLERLQRDWQFQDFGVSSACFTSSEGHQAEKEVLQKILDSLAKRGVDVQEFREELDFLTRNHLPANDTRWRSLYFQLCQIRRDWRLRLYLEKELKIVFTKHPILGGPQIIEGTEEVSDGVRHETARDYRPGSQLCLLTLHKDGRVTREDLLTTTTGTIRDPALSFDARQLAFSMRANRETDDYHLYVMEMDTREIRQITFGVGFCDIEPAFLPNDDLVFTSTRCGQYNDCWFLEASNLYLCDSQGRYLRRIGFDQLTTFYPQVLDDGRIIYTRWEYNDRNPLWIQSLFVMNPDGTNQTEYYGNNSWFPTAIIHARGIPGTQKVIAISTGHHVEQRGKLIEIDRRQGTQEGEGIHYLAPVRAAVSVHPKPQADRPVVSEFHELSGESFQYPFALDENHFLVGYLPEGRIDQGRASIPFGIYWMNREGERELLAFDPEISCNQSIPVLPRPRPFPKASTVDYSQETGTFYVQDIYFGPGLQNVPRGTIRQIRVVALEYRPVGVTYAYTQGEGGTSHMTTPVSINNGSWDVKHVLGTVDVDEDGSAFFEVPARTPVYFQMLDEKGYVVQTMRSWATLQPGEFFSCIGCHEEKNVTFSTEKNLPQKPPQKIRPFYRHEDQPVSEWRTLASPEQRKTADFLGRNAPKGYDYPQGFSFLRDVQPILDRHCVDCHYSGAKNEKEDGKPMMDLTATESDIDWRHAPMKRNDQQFMRRFATSYLHLTAMGNDRNPLVHWINAEIRPTMLPPYFAGAARSKLMAYLEPTHYDVSLTDYEKRMIACWIDLLVPFCGSYFEANRFEHCQMDGYWSEHSRNLTEVYHYHEQKRFHHAEIERIHMRKFLENQQHGKEHSVDSFPKPTLGGREVKSQFVKSWASLKKERPILSTPENYARNPQATVCQPHSWPYATSNSHFRYRPEFSPAMAIDGKEDTWWQPLRQKDAWLKIEFGQTVHIRQVVLTLKVPTDVSNAWSAATLRFLDSDGKELIREKIDLKKSSEPQIFNFTVRPAAAVEITNLRSPIPPRDAGIIEVEIR
ncbi:MAG: hypothetical protein Q4D62_12890 [Planctomycetia bacterium]|nr:hypothetical protein [Planctomycetia bacterium]